LFRNRRVAGPFALADGVDKLPEFAEGFRQFKNNFAVPALFLHNFPSWFAGVAFAAIGIGALVPAAIMSIAAANLFTRNVYREFFRARATDKQEAQMANKPCCCALVASGHAAAPPRRVMTSRRAIIRSPRRRWRAGLAVR
jgi:Na+/proline symporter